MATLLSRILSTTKLLYAFIIITQIEFGFYYGRGSEPPAAITLIYTPMSLWIVGWWLRNDSRHLGIPLVYDMGMFLNIAWPFIMPYYLVKSRGAKGLLVLLAFVGTYLGALLVSITISVFAGMGD